jgi:hypothetical protein
MYGRMKLLIKVACRRFSGVKQWKGYVADGIKFLNAKFFEKPL